LSVGVDKYTSLAATADGRRLVATRSSPKATFWRLPMTDAGADMRAARRVALTTSSGTAPRLGADYLLYVAPKGTSDSIWRLQGEAAAEVWSAPDARVLGAPAIARDGRRIAFAIRQSGRTSLYVANADGTDPRIVTRSLELQGGPAWAPDGASLTVAAFVDGVPSLFRVPLDGGAPQRLAGEYSVDPVWTPSGDLVVYSGADVGTTFPVKAITADAKPHPRVSLTLSRGARHLVFAPGQRALVVLRGEIRHKNLWAIDLETGAERQLTDFDPDFDVRDFDVAPDGSAIVLEQVEERSDIVMLEVPRR
jgi:Tol biopolymer transport system component